MSATSPTPPIALTSSRLNVPKESTYFALVLIVSIIVWVIVAVTIVGIFYGALFALLAWLGNGLLTAHLRSEAVRVTERQLPELHATFARAWEKLGSSGPIPHLYVIQSGGALNAFATRFSGRNFVVVYSDLLEAFGPSSPEMQFILGHEIGHIKSNHLLKHLLLAPGLFMPLIGPAYLRACESSCDLHGAFASDDMNGAVRAMLTLGGGRGQSRVLDADAFASQHGDERGFFVSWHELTSGYPTLSARTAQLINLSRPGAAPTSPSRNPFAYLFALMTPGGRFAAGGNMLVMIVIIGLLAAMAIPAFAKVREQSMAKVCINNQRMISAAYDQVALEKGKAPESYDDFIGPGKPLAAMPTCLAHGEYEVNANDNNTATVTCSVHTP
jgi:Zn-dependent protease with chaperone function/competence protein ComGC